MLNPNSTLFQLSFEVYNVSVVQKLKFLGFRQFLTQKVSNFQIFSYRNVMYLKRKLRTCRIQIQEEKVWFLWKKWIFFYFSEFRVKIIGDQVSSRRNFSKSWKKNLKNGFARSCWLLKGTKSRKISSFDASPEEPRSKNCRVGLTLSRCCAGAVFPFIAQRRTESFLVLFIYEFDPTCKLQGNRNASLQNIHF